MRSIIKILTLLSALASIGSFLLAALQLANGNRADSIDATGASNSPAWIQVAAREGRLDSAAGFCILTMAVCGAGMVVIRAIKMRGPGR